jgi:hypothetical protein
VTPGGARAIMAAVEQLTFGSEPAVVRAAVGPSGPGYEIERELAAAGASCVAGVDEVGRGAWAGPVTVCAVIVRAGFPDPPAGLTDSKRLSPLRRAAIERQLSWVEAFAIGEAGPAEIDAAGMTAALRRAAVRALERLPARPGMLLLDGGPGPTLRASCPCYDLGCRDEASDANTTVELR